jgi:hypothetical protein
VTSVDRSNHNACDLAYRAAGQSYQNSDACDATVPGEIITVTYDAHDPTVVTPRNPSDAFESGLIVLIVAAAGFAAGVTFAIRKVVRSVRAHGGAYFTALC